MEHRKEPILEALEKNVNFFSEPFEPIKSGVRTMFAPLFHTLRCDEIEKKLTYIYGGM